MTTITDRAAAVGSVPFEAQEVILIAERNGSRSESDCRAKLGDLESKHG